MRETCLVSGACELERQLFFLIYWQCYCIVKIINGFVVDLLFLMWVYVWRQDNSQRCAETQYTHLSHIALYLSLSLALSVIAESFYRVVKSLLLHITSGVDSRSNEPYLIHYTSNSSSLLSQLACLLMEEENDEEHLKVSQCKNYLGRGLLRKKTGNGMRARIIQKLWMH